MSVPLPLLLASMCNAPIQVNKRAKRDSLETKTQPDKPISMAKFSVRGVNPLLDIGLVLWYGSEAHWGPATDEAASDANSQPDRSFASSTRSMPTGKDSSLCISSATFSITLLNLYCRRYSKSDRGFNHPMLRHAIIPWPLRIQINEKEVADNEAAEPVATAAATAALKVLMRGKTVDKKSPP
ncbi:hypothetical protein B0H14DRAFT_2622088 [Mycena olivaceomarginata]|nr:hypothetical protein B0H14DRAFT_2622088 [Mycena olivaceomarginata]